MNKLFSAFFLGIFLFPVISIAQDEYYYQTDFSKEEFAERRARIFDAIGNQAVAVIQGAAARGDHGVFRQTNTFYYLTGIESEHAYLMIDARRRTSTLYLQHRDEGRERSSGKSLSAEDAELVKELTGIENVKPIERLSFDLNGIGGIRPPRATVFTPMSPAENGNDSRDESLRGQALISADPWDGRPSRESHFVSLIQKHSPQIEVKDLSPILDTMRRIKSPKEIELIRKATDIAGLGIIEAMKSTNPGVYEYQLEAAAKYQFYLHDSQGDGYAAIIGGGSNAYFGHYWQNTDPLVDGDLVLMDYAPDYHYYTSDVTRMWPVNGEYTEAQVQLTEYILAYKDALFRYIKPGVTSEYVLDNAAKDMREYLKGKKFANPAHQKAVEEGVEFRGHFQHPVGMAVHDVGGARGMPLEPGMVFTIDPMIWIPEERLYIRIEDMALVTEGGVENLSEFVPYTIEDIKKTIKETGVIEFRPAQPLPLKDN